MGIEDYEAAYRLVGHIKETSNEYLMGRITALDFVNSVRRGVDVYLDTVGRLPEPPEAPNCRCAVVQAETCGRCRLPITDICDRVSVGLKQYHRDCYHEFLEEEDDRRAILSKIQRLERDVEKLSKEIIELRVGTPAEAVCKGTACRI